MSSGSPPSTSWPTRKKPSARDVNDIIKSKKSARGDIVIDTRTNSLIVSDVQEKIDLIDEIVATLDAATPQVTIETRIVEATSTFVRNLGIQWGYKAIADPFYGNQTSLQFPNKMLADGACRRRLDPPGNRHQGPRRAARRLRRQPAGLVVLHGRRVFPGQRSRHLPNRQGKAAARSSRASG